MSELMSENGCAEQLAEWLKGNPVHNMIRDECCPDFSCCNPGSLVPPEIRQEFVDADEEKRQGMLMMFLGGAFETLGKRDQVYIAGMDGGDEN